AGEICVRGILADRGLAVTEIPEPLGGVARSAVGELYGEIRLTGDGVACSKVRSRGAHYRDRVDGRVDTVAIAVDKFHIVSTEGGVGLCGRGGGRRGSVAKVPNTARGNRGGGVGKSDRAVETDGGRTAETGSVLAEADRLLK